MGKATRGVEFVGDFNQIMAGYDSDTVSVWDLRQTTDSGMNNVRVPVKKIKLAANEENLSVHCAGIFRFVKVLVF